MRRKKASAILALNLDIDKSSIPATGDIEFPPAEKWIEMSKRRSKNNVLTDTERAILKALDATVSVDFKDQRFGGVVDWFQHQMGQTIVLDKPALDDLGVNNESTINVTLNKVSTRTALKKILADLGLTYVVKDETIFVTTPAKAKDMMTIRTYYIGDLIGGYRHPVQRRADPVPGAGHGRPAGANDPGQHRPRTPGRPTARRAAARSSSTRST